MKPEDLERLLAVEMPFGKYKDRYLIHLPENYLVWFKQNGFPAGKLGQQLELVYEIKMNGLEHLIYPLMPKSNH